MVESYPRTTGPTESPTRIMSTPAAARMRENTTSYAVMATIRFPSRLSSRRRRTEARPSFFRTWVDMDSHLRRCRPKRCQTSPRAGPRGKGDPAFARAPRPDYLRAMTLRWDPLLVRELARELDAGLAGAHLRAIRLDGEARRMTLLFGEGTLDWSLHPSRGAPMLLPPTEPGPGDLTLP